MENRNGLVVDACLTPADGRAERVAALHMIEPHAGRPQAITLGADKAYDAEDFVNELRSMKVTPHVAQNTSGRLSWQFGGALIQPLHQLPLRARENPPPGSVRLLLDIDKLRVIEPADVGYWPIVFSNSGVRCQALQDHPCRAHCSLRGRGAPSA
jgi:hypothetical protein